MSAHKAGCFSLVPSGMWLEFARPDLRRREAIWLSICIQTASWSKKARL